MAANVGTVFMDVQWDVPKMSKDLSAASKAAADKAAPAAAKSLEDKFTSLSNSAVDAGKKMSIGISLPVVAGLTLATKKASDLEQAVGGTSAIFGASAPKLAAFAKGAADAVGLSEEAARTLTTQLGGALKGYGFSVDEAADKSIQLTQLGADLAATFGGTTTDAVTALSAALRGEFDPLERFGIAINQTLIDQKAVAMGLATSTGNVNQHARAQAALAMIMERSASAQGQFAREADTAAGAAQRAGARAENAAADLGKAFLPIYTKISEATAATGKGFQALPESAQTGFAGLAVAAVVVGPLVFGLGKIGQGIGAVVSAGQRLSTAQLDRKLGSIGTYSDAVATKTTALSSSVSGLTSVMAGAAAVAGAWAVMQQRNADVVAGLVDPINAAISKAAAAGEWDQLQTRLKDLDSQIANFQEQGNREWFQLWDADRTAQADAAQDALKNTRAEAEKNVLESERLAKATGSSNGEALKFLTTQREGGRTFNTITEAAAAYRAEQTKTGGAVENVTAKMDAQRQAAQKMGQQFFGVIDANKSYKDALKGVADAQQGARDAQQKIGDAQRAYRDSLQKVADAQQSYRESVRKIGDAQRAYQDSVRAISDAELRRRESLQGVEDAQRKVIDAQRDLDAALRGPGESDQISLERAKIALTRSKQTLSKGGFKDALERQSAQLDVRQAQADLDRIQAEIAGQVGVAQAALASAQQGLLTAQKQAEDSARGVEDAQRASADAARAVGDAQRDAAAASRAVSDAQLDVTSSAKGVADAQRDAATAGQAVATANEEAARQALELKGKQDDLATAFRTSPDSVGPFIAQLQWLKDNVPGIGGVVDEWLAKFRAAQQATQPQTGQVPYYIAAPGAPSAEPPKRATGGPVWPGQPFQVNETGVAELLNVGRDQYLIPTQRGEVVPMDKVAAKANGGAPTVNNYNLPPVNARQLAGEISYYQGRQVRGRRR